MTPARFRWGILFILLGTLLFLRNLDIIRGDFWVGMVMFFPVLLIAIGIEKIFTKTKFQIVSYATSILIFAAGLGFAVSENFGYSTGSYFSESHVAKQHDDSVKRIVAEVEVDATALTIRDSGEDIINASFDRFTRKPEWKYDVVGDRAEVKMTSRGNDFVGGIVKVETDNQQDWMVSFSNSIPLDFVCKGDDADVHLNLETTPLENLVLDLQNSYIYLKLGDLMPLVHVKIDGEDSNLKLRIPEEVGVRISADGYESYFEHVGMKKDNGWFVKSGNDTLKSQVEINMNAKLSSFSIDYF